MRAKIVGMSTWQGTPKSGTLTVWPDERYEDGNGNATVGRLDYVLDVASRTWRDAHNPLADAYAVVAAPGEPFPSTAMFEEVFTYAGRSPVRTIFRKELVASDLNATEYSYISPQNVQAYNSREPLTMEAAREFLGFKPELEEAIGMFGAVLTSMDQSASNLLAAAGGATPYATEADFPPAAGNNGKAMFAVDTGKVVKAKNDIYEVLGSILTPGKLTTLAGYSILDPLPELQSMITFDATRWGIKGDGVARPAAWTAMLAAIEAKTRKGAWAGAEIMLPLGNVRVDVRVDSVVCPIIFRGRGVGGTRLIFGADNLTMFRFSGKGGGLRDLLVDGALRTGCKAFELMSSDFAIFENVVFESIPTMGTSTYSNYARFESCLIRACLVGLDMGSASNCFTFINSNFYSGLAGTKSIIGRNSSTLVLINTNFQGVVLIDLWNFETFSVIGGYYEDDQERNSCYIKFGTGNAAESTGLPVRGISLHGVQFNHGAKAALRLVSVDGLDVSGCRFGTEYAYELYTHDNAWKRYGDLSSNSYEDLGLRALAADPARTWYPGARAGTRTPYVDPAKLFLITGSTADPSKTLPMRLVIQATQEFPLTLSPNTAYMPNNSSVRYLGSDNAWTSIRKNASGVLHKRKERAILTAATRPLNADAQAIEAGKVVELTGTNRHDPFLIRKNSVGDDLVNGAVGKQFDTLYIPMQFSWAHSADIIVPANGFYMVVRTLLAASETVKTLTTNDFPVVGAGTINLNGAILGQAQLTTTDAGASIRINVPIINMTAAPITVPAGGRWRAEITPGDTQF